MTSFDDNGFLADTPDGLTPMNLPLETGSKIAFTAAGEMELTAIVTIPSGAQKYVHVKFPLSKGSHWLHIWTRLHEMMTPPTEPV